MRAAGRVVQPGDGHGDGGDVNAMIQVAARNNDGRTARFGTRMWAVAVFGALVIAVVGTSPAAAQADDADATRADVDKAISQLAADDVADRQAARAALASLDEDLVIEALVAVVDDSAADVALRVAALRALGTVAEGRKEPVAVLMSASRSEAPALRAAAIVGMGDARGMAVVVQRLIELTAAESATEARAACEALGRHESADAIAPLTALVADAGRPVEVRVAAAVALGDTLAANPAGEEVGAARDALALVAAGADGTPIDLWQTAALADGRLGGERALRPLLGMLQRPHHSLAAAAARRAAKEARDEATGDEAATGDVDERIADTAAEATARAVALQKDEIALIEAARVIADQYGEQVYPDVIVATLEDLNTDFSRQGFQEFCARVGEPIIGRLAALLDEEANRSIAADTLRGLLLAEPAQILRLAPADQLERDVLVPLIRDVLAQIPAVETVELLYPLVGPEPYVAEAGATSEDTEPPGETDEAGETGEPGDAAETPEAGNDADPHGGITHAEVRRAVMRVFAELAHITPPVGPSGAPPRLFDEGAAIIDAGILRLDDPDTAVLDLALTTLDALPDRLPSREIAPTGRNLLVERLRVERDLARVERMILLLPKLAETESRIGRGVRPGDAIAQSLRPLLTDVDDAQFRARFLRALASLDGAISQLRQLERDAQNLLRDAEAPVDVRLAAAEFIASTGTNTGAALLATVLTTDTDLPAELRTLLLDKLKERDRLPAQVSATSLIAYFERLWGDYTGAGSPEGRLRETLLSTIDLLGRQRADDSLRMALRPLVDPRDDGLDVAALKTLNAGGPETAELPAELLDAVIDGVQVSGDVDYRREGMKFVAAASRTRGNLRAQRAVRADALAQQMLRDSTDTDTRIAAVTVLGQLLRRSAADRLKSMYADPQTADELREAVIAAMARIEPTWTPPARAQD
jgi:hypothetical protein